MEGMHHPAYSDAVARAKAEGASTSGRHQPHQRDQKAKKGGAAAAAGGRGAGAAASRRLQDDLFAEFDEFGAEVCVCLCFHGNGCIHRG